jgi:hypothetical protein
MDEAMMKAGGEGKRRELLSQFGELSLSEDRGKMSEEELKRAREGDEE